MVVQLETDCGDLAVLLLAEQVAGAANLEVAHRELEPRAEVLQVADDVESLVGLLGERARGRIHHVGVGALPRAPDAAAQLVQLREPETVRVIDHDGVRVGNVEPGLDDGRAQQHVDLAVAEPAHHRREHPFRHLPVRNLDARLGHERAEPIGHGLDARDTVVEEEASALRARARA